jgi:hypothetical protein
MTDTPAKTAQSATAVAPTESATLMEQLCAPTEGTQLKRDQRRTKDRFAIANVFQVIPLGEGGKLLHGESFLASGKDLSTTGIALSHVAPLTCRGAVLSSVQSSAGRFAVEAEVVWNRPAKDGLYETGFRLVRKLAAHQLRSS